LITKLCVNNWKRTQYTRNSSTN